MTSTLRPRFWPFLVRPVWYMPRSSLDKILGGYPNCFVAYTEQVWHGKVKIWVVRFRSFTWTSLAMPVKGGSMFFIPPLLILGTTSKVQCLRKKKTFVNGGGGGWRPYHTFWQVSKTLIFFSQKSTLPPPQKKIWVWLLLQESEGEVCR